MNVTRSVLAALMLAVVVPAQAGAQKPSAKSPEYDKLVAEWTAATKTYSDASKALQATDAFKEAVAAKDQKKINELRATIARPDAKGFGTRAIALADKSKGEVALPVLTFAASKIGDADTTKAVVERVRKNHLKSAGLGELLENGMVLSRSLGAEEANKLLDEVIAQNPNPLPKAWAMYWQAVALQRDKNASDDVKAKAEELLAGAGKLAAGTELADRIAAPTFEKERLQIGMEVPDIVGEDVDGVPFKLSDYRGKVVLLDYWGFW